MRRLAVVAALVSLLALPCLAAAQGHATASVSGLVLSQTPFYLGFPTPTLGGCFLRIQVSASVTLELQWFAPASCSTSLVGELVAATATITNQRCVLDACETVPANLEASVVSVAATHVPMLSPGAAIALAGALVCVAVARLRAPVSRET